MSIRKQDCAGVILAGGMSRRMGRCKAELEIDGETMLSRTARCFAGFPELLISANDPALGADLGRVVPDEYPGQGPLAGLHAAMGSTDRRAILCLPCDLPRFTPEAAEYLLGEYSGEDVLVFSDRNGRLHPLCGIYSCALRPRIGEMLKKGERRIQDLLDRSETRILRPGDDLPDSVFFNVNTPEDFERICADGALSLRKKL